MAKRRGQKPKSIPMKIGNDPALWRYASLEAALTANTELLARLIQSGADQARVGNQPGESAEPLPATESTR